MVEERSKWDGVKTKIEAELKRIVEHEMMRFKEKFGLRGANLCSTDDHPFVRIEKREVIVVELEHLKWVIEIVIKNQKPFEIDKEPALHKFPSLASKIAELISKEFNGQVITWIDTTEDETIHYLGVLSDNDVIEIYRIREELREAYDEY